MADFHAADLWVAVVPSTEKVGPAMEEAGREAKSKFGQAVKGIGQTIDDDLHKVGSKAKDTFTSVGQHAKDAFRVAGREAGSILSSEIGKAATEAIPGLDKLSGSIQGIGDAVRSAKVGDFTTALDGASQALKNLEPVAKNFGIDISGWQAPLGDVRDKSKSLTDTYDLLKGNIKDTTDGFRTFTNDAPRFAGAFEMIGKAAGPVAMTLASIAALDKNFAGNMDKLLSGLQSHDPGKILSGGGGMMWDSLKDYSTLFGLAPMPWQHQGESHSSHTFTYWPGFKGAPQGLSRGSDGSLIFSGTFGTPGVGAGLEASPAPSSSSGWDRVAQAESGGNWHINTGNGYFGGLQFDQNTWNDFGGRDFAPRPDLATPDQQKAVADRVPVGQRAGRWPNTYKNFGGGSGVGSIASSSLDLGGGDFGAGAGNPTVAPPDENSIRSWVQDNFGIPNTFGTGSWENRAHSHDGGWHHRGLGGKDVDSGYAFDFHGTPEQMANLANWVADNYRDQTLELIYGGAGFNRGREIKNAKFGDVYGAGLNAEHRDHVHWAMTRPPWAGGRGGGMAGQMPVGTEHDPLYVTQAQGSGGGRGGSPFESQGQQLGQGLVNGVLQMFGLDGSVFGGKSPLDFSAVKLGGGLLNYGMGLMNSMASGPMGAPGMSSGGGGGLLSGLAGLIPHPGPMVSASAGAGGGSFGIKDAVGGPTTIHQDNRIITSGNTIKDAGELVMLQQWERNSRFHSYQGGLPAPS